MKQFVSLIIILVVGCKSNSITSQQKIEFTSIKKALKTPLLVTKLNLSNQNLNQIPNGVYELDNLQYLNLSGNKLDYIPKKITNLESLEYLNFSRNDLTSIPSYIENLSKIETLQLSHNKISAVPKQMANMQSLKKLILIYNDLDESDVSYIRKNLPVCEIAVTVLK